MALHENVTNIENMGGISSMSLSKYGIHYIEWLLSNITRKSSALNWSN